MKTCAILYDLETKFVLAASPFSTVIIKLHECVPETTYVTYVPVPDEQDEGDPLFTDQCCNWRFDAKQRTANDKRSLLDDRAGKATQYVKTRATLANAKRDAFTRIIATINDARTKVRTGLIYEETVYMLKRLEAERFRQSGYDESGIFSYPFLLQYADFANVSYHQAADDILLQSGIDDQILVKTEILRMDYNRRVASAKTPEEITTILADFRAASFSKALV
jgi:hypothetical protein